MPNTHPLFQERDFGAKINATFEYIWANIGPLLINTLIIAVPVAILFTIVFGSLMEMMQGIVAQESMDDAAMVGLVTSLGFNYFFLLLIAYLAYMLMVAAIYGYMKMGENMDRKPSVGEVFSFSLSKLGGLFLLLILTLILTLVGIMLFVLPGIWIGVVMTLAFPIYLFEDVSVSKAFNRSFKLINGKWWSTFGLVIVTALIASVLGYVFSIPVGFFTFAKLFDIIPMMQDDPQAILSLYTDKGLLLGITISMIGTYITYLIPITAIGFQYTNLVKRAENRQVE